MTEAEWLACEDPETMYLFVTETHDLNRKSRMLGCACARRLWHLLGPIYQTAIEVAEKYEDGTASEDELSRAASQAETASHTDYRGDTAVDLARIVVQLASDPRTPFPDLDKAASAFAWDAENAVVDWDEAREKELAVQVALVREIFGNPFRPVPLDPTWLTFDVQALARGIYDYKAFDRMPILADALQDAGCENADVLNHCRDVPATHVRGCWVVDLLLGKG